MVHPAVDFVVVGGGAFGASTALALRARGHSVALVDPGPLPHPDASSTDISKIVRMDYGDDAFHASLAELAFSRWHEWNDRFERPLYHETGILLLSRDPLAPGGFEFESRAVLATMGYPVQELEPAVLGRRFPAWEAATWAHGYFNPTAGWAESGVVVGELLRWASEAGVELREGPAVARVLEDAGRAIGVEDAAGGRHPAGEVVVAAGAWTPELLPRTASFFRSVGQPVFHLRPADPSAFAPDVFPIWCAEIANTGWYGFPARADGIVKVANHGRGLAVQASEKGDMPPEFDRSLRDFLAGTVPGLADAPIVGRRMCLYCDTQDGDFWIDRDPECQGLTVAAGGSGHGFKFVPVIGEIIADAAEGRENLWGERFRWREPAAEHRERARFQGSPVSLPAADP